MKVNVRELSGNWNKGFALDKHTVSSQFLGYNENGKPQFDTTRTPVGEALYQLKYKNDYTKCDILAHALFRNIIPRFTGKIGFITPVPPSTVRARQPVIELSKSLGRMMARPVFENILIKNCATAQLKNQPGKQAKAALLKGNFTINDEITAIGRWDALLIDDLYDSGATLEEATKTLLGYSKVNNIFVATVTWK